MKIRLCSTAVLAMSLAMGCMRMEIKSNMRPNYGKKLHDVCIGILNSRLEDTAFFEALKPELEGRLAERGVRSVVLLLGAPTEAGQGTFSHYLGTEVTVGTKPAYRAKLDQGSLPGKAGFPPAYLLQVELAAVGSDVTQAGGIVHGFGPTGGGGGMVSTTGIANKQKNIVGNLLLTLSEFQGGLKVWKAEQLLEWGNAGFGIPGVMYQQASGISADPIKCAQQIIDTLAKDGLLGSAPASGR